MTTETQTNEVNAEIEIKPAPFSLILFQIYLLHSELHLKLYY